jgi:hypothetical protein
LSPPCIKFRVYSLGKCCSVSFAWEKVSHYAARLCVCELRSIWDWFFSSN